MICQCPAIVLRATDFQETSRIVSVFSRSFGKVSLIAKGARSPKSKFAGKLEPGLIVDAVYHHKPGRSVHTLTDLSVQNPWPPNANHPDRYVARIAFTDLLNRLLPDDSSNESLFDQCAQVLNWMVDTPHHPIQLFPYVVVRLCDWLGIAIQCVQASESGARQGHFEVESGTLSSALDARGTILTNSMYDYLSYSAVGNRKELLGMELPEADLRQMTYILDRYIAYHFDGVRPRTTQILFDSYSEAMS